MIGGLCVRIFERAKVEQVNIIATALSFMMSFRRKLHAKAAEVVGTVGESIIFMNVFIGKGTLGRLRFAGRCRRDSK